MDSVYRPALHRFSILLAAWTFFLIIAGAAVTSHEAGLSVPDWPLSYGKVMPEMKGGVFYEHGHRMVATVAGFLMTVLAIWLFAAEKRTWVKRLGLAAWLAVVAQGVLGGLTVLYQLPKAVSIAHACLAQLFFSTTVIFTLILSKTWIEKGPQIAQDSAWPSMRSISIGVAGLVLAQLAMGAAFRHRAAGLVPHVIGAMVVTSAILFEGISLFTQFKQHATLKRAGAIMMSVVAVQLLLGLAAYQVRVETAGAATPQPIMVLFTVAHVAVGALALASTIFTAVQVFRHTRRVEATSPVRPREAQKATA
jgi:cytochrome c oxidase assembly protein subunit 15